MRKYYFLMVKSYYLLELDISRWKVKRKISYIDNLHKY